MENKAPWNQKVVKNRGIEWKKKLLSGRLDIQMNPSHLRLKRIKKNRTQKEVAAQVGMSCATYGAVESGQRPVVKIKAEKIAKALSVPFQEAFSVSDDNPNRYIANKG